MSCCQFVIIKIIFLSGCCTIVPALLQHGGLKSSGPVLSMTSTGGSVLLQHFVISFSKLHLLVFMMACRGDAALFLLLCN